MISLKLSCENNPEWNFSFSSPTLPRVGDLLEFQYLHEGNAVFKVKKTQHIFVGTSRTFRHVLVFVKKVS